MRSGPRELFWGLALIAAGLILLLVRLGWLPPSADSLWPLVVFFFGLWLVARAVMRPGARGVTAGVVVMAVGAYWFAEGLGWVSEDVFLAVLLLALGLGLISRSLLLRPGSS
jgi:hypothetical protein